MENINTNSLNNTKLNHNGRIAMPTKDNTKPNIMNINFGNKNDYDDEPIDDEDDVIPEDLELPKFALAKERISRHLSKKDFIKEQVKTLKKRMSEIKNTKYDPEKNIDISYYDDSRPQNKKYFQYSKYFGKDPKGVAVIIPFYNEESKALRQTLNSLYETISVLRLGSEKWRNSVFYVCLIQDGWNKASVSMKNYLKCLFPKKIRTLHGDKYWWDYYKDFNCTEEELSKMPDRTFVFEKKNYSGVKINPEEKFSNDNKFMKISLIVKTKNRRKHNSHEWFLGKNGFADSVNPEYLFLTDAFALYNKWLLYHLAKKLDKNDNMVAVTGRQRLMSRAQQGSNVSTFSLGNLLTNVQLYDFESSNAMYNGAFSLGKSVIPVIPGPCGLYRAGNLLSDKIRDYYFETVNKNPDETGMILGNLRIAEDRVLSYAAVIKSDNPKAYMQFHPLALFYFEAETDLATLLYQRRRWINGSVAGYIYLLFVSLRKDFMTWKAGWIRKIYAWILLMCQFLTYMMVGLAPSIILRIFYHGVNYFFEYYNIHFIYDIYIFGFGVWALYLAHVYFHHTRTDFNYIIMYCLLLLSFATSIISIGSLLHYTFIYSNMTPIDIIYSGDVVIYLGLYIFFGPFFVSLLLSGKGHSFLFMLKSFVAYYLFLPMLIAWFGSYSYARTWDLSWGNRPSSEMDAVSSQKKEQIMKKYKSQSRIITSVLFIMNILLFIAPLKIQKMLMAIFFVLAGYQLTLSIIYCLLNVFIKIAFIFKKCRVSCSKKKNMETNDAGEMV